MSFLKDFREFAVRGNVMDLAVGVIIGAAFGKIVTAMVDDVLMPLIGLIGDGKKFTDKFIVLRSGKSGAAEYKSLAEAKTDGANLFAYGDFIQTIVDFMIVAFCIFIIVRMVNQLVHRREEKKKVEVPEETSTDRLLKEILDELKTQRRS